MATFYTAGDYWGSITKQAMGKTSTDKPQFIVSFTVLGQVDPQDESTYIPAEQQYERTMFRVITDKTVKYAVEDLEQLDLNINDWGQLDPSHPQHVSAVGTHNKFRCSHEMYQGNNGEKWSLARGGSGVKVDPLSDVELRKLNAMFGKSLKSPGPKPAPKAATPPVSEKPDPNAELQAAGNTKGNDLDVPF